jgi:hypothetical protein
MPEDSRSNGHVPAMIAGAIAAIGVLALLFVNHGPWNAPEVPSETMIQSGITAAAADAAGVTVTRTPPKL